MKLSQYAKQNNISYQTAWNHWKKGIINAKQLPSGTIVVVDENNNDKQNICVIYARVSSSQNKNNLDSQADRLYQYATTKGYQIYKIVKEIGSGINDSRPKLLELLNDNNYSILIVEHKDRLTRFGFKYIETLFKSLGKSIDVINLSNNNKEDIIEDLTSIITSFCARIYGQRRCKRKTEKIIEELKNDQEINSQS